MGSEVDWYRVVLIAALAGGVFWGAGAGVILATRASAVAVVALCFVSLAAIVAGWVTYRRGQTVGTRSAALALTLAPLTGATTLAVFGLAAFFAQAMS